MTSLVLAPRLWLMSKATICSLAAVTLLLVTAASANAATAVSSNWSGYVVAPKTSGTKFKTVYGTWVVPPGDCSSGAGYEATWVGLGGYTNTSRSLEQTGTEFDCNADGTVKYSAWYELVPAAGHDIKMTVKPGDTIDAAVTVNGSKVTLYLKNRTRGTSFRRTFTMKAPDTTTAEWIVEAPSQCNSAGQCVQLPLSNFGTTTFNSASATTMRGTHGSISSSHWKNTQVTLSQGGGPRRFAQYATARGAEPSALTAGGTSFSVAYSEQAPSSESAPPMLSPGAGGV